ncbi:MAG TPA: hypothetical protein VGN97_18745 [Mesorhizobium sp.]|jgi:hypothetical protein|nr:hypothetical protein [Mesorhizobium sp.]
MTPSRLVARVQERLEKRRRYNRLVNEILGMSARDLIDIRGDRGQMLRDAYREIYG